MTIGGPRNPAPDSWPIPAGVADTERRRAEIVALFGASPRAPVIETLSQRTDRALADRGIGLWQCDLATERLTWSQGVWDLFAMERGEAPRRASTVARYFLDSRIMLEQVRRIAIATGRGFEIEAGIVDARGRQRWMRISAQIERIGGEARLFGVKRDITGERITTIGRARLPVAGR